MRLYDKDDDDDDHEEDDEEEEGLILIKEKQAPENCFALSQLTEKTSSQHSQSQQHNLTPTRLRRTQIISRQERRKRRNEWKERQLLDQQQQFNSSQLTPPLLPPIEDDAFASLQALLPNSPKVTPLKKMKTKQKQKQNKGMGGHHNLTAKEEKLTASNANKSKKKKSTQRDDAMSSPSKPQSPPMLCYDDDEHKAEQTGDRTVLEQGDTRIIMALRQNSSDRSADGTEKRKGKSKGRLGGPNNSTTNRGFDEDDFDDLFPIPRRKKQRSSIETLRHCIQNTLSSSSSPFDGSKPSSQSKNTNVRLLNPFAKSKKHKGRSSQTMTQTEPVKHSVVGSR